MSLSCGRHRGTSSQDRDAFLRCRNLVTVGNYQEASHCLEQFTQAHPHSKFASRAGLFLGKAELGQGHLDKARRAWLDVKTQYPRTLEGHKVQYKLAVLLMLEGKRDEAQRAFRSMADAPSGPLAPEASAMTRFLDNE